MELKKAGIMKSIIFVTFKGDKQKQFDIHQLESVHLSRVISLRLIEIIKFDSSNL